MCFVLVQKAGVPTILRLRLSCSHLSVNGEQNRIDANKLKVDCRPVSMEEDTGMSIPDV